VNLTFSYSPQAEVVPLKKSRGGTFNPTTLPFAEEALERGIDFDDEAQTIPFITERLQRLGLKPDAFITELTKTWEPIAKNVEERLTQLFPTDLDLGSIIVYVTQSQRCPYNVQQNLFYVSMVRIGSITTLLHELLHFYTHKLYEQRFFEINRADFGDFKEALTIILNLTFSDILDQEDMGYPQHAQLRNEIAEQWGKTPSITAITEWYLTTHHV
jgi:hypothetical protein